MQLRINGQLRTFIDFKTFRQQYALPNDFGISTFEKKDYSGLGKIEGAGAALADLRAAMLGRLPTQSPNWLNTVDDLEKHFRRELERINPQVGLRDSELDFAVGGFADVLRAVVYAKMRPLSPTFDEVYMDWLSDSVRVSALIHSYAHADEVWEVQVVNHAYGRMGLYIQTGQTDHYVVDARLACPAQGFMTDLLRELGQRILAL